MARGGKREGAGRKPKDRSKQQEAQTALIAARSSAYHPGLCSQVEAIMAEGYSLTAFAGKIGVARSTLNGWMAEFPDFAEAVSRAKCVRLLHWEDAAMRVVKSGGGPGTATIIIFGLKNMGSEDWTDKQTTEHTGPNGSPIEVDNAITITFVRPSDIPSKGRL